MNVEEVKAVDGILDSVKKPLGLSPEIRNFDSEILIFINSGITTLAQIGIGPRNGFFVSGEDQTYQDYLGEDCQYLSMVNLFLFYTTKLGWDPPQSSMQIEVLKELIREMTWRLNAQVDPKDTFD